MGQSFASLFKQEVAAGFVWQFLNPAMKLLVEEFARRSQQPRMKLLQIPVSLSLVAWFSKQYPFGFPNPSLRIGMFMTG
jgi:hypothetical protein